VGPARKGLRLRVEALDWPAPQVQPANRSLDWGKEGAEGGESVRTQWKIHPFANASFQPCEVPAARRVLDHPPGEERFDGRF
jgi:hypothetical protein